LNIYLQKVWKFKFAKKGKENYVLLLKIRSEEDKKNYMKYMLKGNVYYLEK